MVKRYQRLKFNLLKMYFGDDYVVDLEGLKGKIVIHQPTMEAIIQSGDDEFYQTLSVFVNTTASSRLMLWDNGIDWNEITDFDLFCITYKTINPEISKYFFGDLDWNKFKIVSFKIDEEKSEIRLLNEEDEIEINEEVFEHIHQYLQNMFKMIPPDYHSNYTDSSVLKKLWIRKDRVALNQAQKKQKQKISLLSQISSYINHPGTKYKLSELREIGISEFYDSLERLRIYEHTTALLKGMFSGMIDGKKIKPEDYDFMKEIIKE